MNVYIRLTGGGEQNVGSIDAETAEDARRALALLLDAVAEALRAGTPILDIPDE